MGHHTAGERSKTLRQVDKRAMLAAALCFSRPITQTDTHAHLREHAPSHKWQIPSMLSATRTRLRCFSLCSFTNTEREAESEWDRKRKGGKRYVLFYLLPLWNLIPHSFPLPLCQSLFFCMCCWRDPLDTEEVVQLIPDPHWRHFALRHTSTQNPLSFLFLTHKPLSLSFYLSFCSKSLLVSSLPSSYKYEGQTTKRYHRQSVGKHLHHRWEVEREGKRSRSMEVEKRSFLLPSVCPFPSILPRLHHFSTLEWHCYKKSQTIITSILYNSQKGTNFYCLKKMK